MDPCETLALLLIAACFYWVTQIRNEKPSALMSCSANPASESKVTYICIHYVKSTGGTCSSTSYIEYHLINKGQLFQCLKHVQIPKPNSSDVTL